MRPRFERAGAFVFVRAATAANLRSRVLASCTRLNGVLMARVTFRRATMGAVLLLTAVASLGACRSVLGIDDQAGPVGADAGDSGDEAGPSSFTVVNGAPDGPALNCIKGWDKDHWIAVGNDELSYVYINGQLTRLGGSSLGRDLNGVWGLTPTNVYAVGAVGGKGFIEHWDGTVWTPVFDAPTQLFAVWGIADGTVLATGEKGIMYGIKKGSGWEKVQTIDPNPDLDASVGPDMWGISGRSFDDFTIAGDVNYFVHTENQSFAWYEPLGEDIRFRSAFQLPGPRTSVIFGTNYWGMYWFSASSDHTSDASIIPPGSGFALTRLYRDERSPDGKDSYLQGVWASANKAVGVGTRGRIIVFDQGFSSVTRVPSPTDASLGGVWGAADDDVWIVGDRELILHGSVK